MLFLYFTIELVLYSFMILITFAVTNKKVVHISRFLPILFNLLFAITQDMDWRLKIALFMSVCADICFLFLKNFNVGVALYLLVQVHYDLYLNSKPKSLFYKLALINIVWVTVMTRELILPTMLYIGLSFINLANVKKVTSKIKSMHPFKWAISLLALCDSCIVFKKACKKSRLLNFMFDILEWGTYIPSQILVVLTGLKNRHLKKNYAV